MVRNSERHSGADSLVVKGWVDFDRGWISVEDAGRGFDPADVASGRFGLVGAKERAEHSGVRLDIQDSNIGTRVTLEWGQSL